MRSTYLREIVDGASPAKHHSEPSHPSFQINLQGNADSMQVAQGNRKTASFFADEARRGSMKIAFSGDNSRRVDADIDSDICEEEGDLKESERSLHDGVSYASPHSLGESGGASSAGISTPSRYLGSEYDRVYLDLCL